MKQTAGIFPDPRFEMLSAAQVAQILNVKRTRAYAIVRTLNEELEKQGKIIIRGKISRAYFESKFYHEPNY